jgi:uncharacterized SAM-binding protein YcdF (DUF218 family)
MRFRKHIFKIFRVILILLGAISLLLFTLAFTPVPFYAWYHLGTSNSGIHRPPDCIVVLGGGGMPSETGLMRSWYASRIAGKFPKAQIIIALPGDTADSLSSVYLMKAELVERGIEAARISFEPEGTNTRAQAVNLLPTPQPPPLQERGSILLISSPDHIYRAVLTFKKAGFPRVDGLPAFERAIESDLNFNSRKIGGKRWVPDVGESIAIRYGFWTQLRYEQLVIREYAAIAYYWILGWV